MERDISRDRERNGEKKWREKNVERDMSRDRERNAERKKKMESEKNGERYVQR